MHFLFWVFSVSAFLHIVAIVCIIPRFPADWSKRKHRLIVMGICLLMVVSATMTGIIVTGFAYFHRPIPKSLEQEFLPGVRYFRTVLTKPRPVIYHLIQIKLDTPSLEFVISEADRSGGREFNAKTTSQFLQDNNLRLAVNGGFFEPRETSTPWDYYPQSGDPVNYYGYSVSSGVVASEHINKTPTLYISEQNEAFFTPAPKQPFHAIAGGRMILLNGQINTREDRPAHTLHRAPRTIYGLDKSAEFLYLMVIDGNQPNYSEGVTLEEAAQFAQGIGMYHALNMDGGGSSTMVIAGEPHGKPLLLNSPVHTHIPGRQRPVANHLGIRFKAQQ